MNLLLLVSIFFTLINNASASPVPDLPPNACYEGCNDFMKSLLNDFENEGLLPSAAPAVYSGECRHLGMYNPEDTHYAVVLLDQKNNAWNFSTIFSFFAADNEFKSWSVETARNEMSPYWNDHGSISTGSEAARVQVNYDNGDPAYIYWMRQNPETKELLYITFAGFGYKSFCRLKLNTEPDN